MFTYSWNWADSRLKGRDSRKVANNTYLKRHDDYIGLLLHNTEVVKYHRNGDVQLDSGGWRTATTKDRMHSWTDAYVSQTKGRWSVRWGGEEHPYADGMILHPDGSVSGTLTRAQEAEQEAAQKAAKKALSKFIAGITPERIVTAFENSGGDCLLCQFGDTTCLSLHVEEGYFHYTLAANAVRAAGFISPETILSMIYHDAKRGRVERLLKDSLRKYMTPHVVTDPKVGRFV